MTAVARVRLHVQRQRARTRQTLVAHVTREHHFVSRALAMISGMKQSLAAGRELPLARQAVVRRLARVRALVAVQAGARDRRVVAERALERLLARVREVVQLQTRQARVLLVALLALEFFYLVEAIAVNAPQPRAEKTLFTHCTFVESDASFCALSVLTSVVRDARWRHYTDIFTRRAAIGYMRCCIFRGLLVVASLCFHCHVDGTVVIYVFWGLCDLMIACWLRDCFLCDVAFVFSLDDNLFDVIVVATAIAMASGLVDRLLDVTSHRRRARHLLRTFVHRATLVYEQTRHARERLLAQVALEAIARHDVIVQFFRLRSIRFLLDVQQKAHSRLVW